ncbi:MAG: hypothetical protein ACRD2W_02350 [Acidimicrobiales bacterium]
MQGDQRFASGLVQRIWQTAYSTATAGSGGHNVGFGGEGATKSDVLDAVKRWRGTPNFGKLVTNFHVPGGKQPIQHKGKRELNPDPLRSDQADFIASWSATPINVHVDVTTASMK